ncbi:MAG: primosomal protein N' [Candidatus Magasanikbacteria bacterium]|nr:primosomal protein N' [Candidatus Magasanikbacteria bacterium]
MIAKVIPLQRLPKSLSVFDYLVPNALADEIAVGQIVEILFRKAKHLGLVFLLADDNTSKSKKLETVQNILNPVPLLSSQQINFLFELSLWYGVSPSTLIKMALPPLQKNKIKKIILKNIKFDFPLLCGGEVSSRLAIAFSQYHDQSEHRTQLKKHLKNKTLILVPEINLIDEVKQLLPAERQEKIVVWHSELSEKQQFENWTQIRNQKKSIIIGTRGAVFLPLDGFKSIIIDYEHDENHKHWDQSPRFHTKDVIAKLNIKTTLLSYSPSAATYYHVHKKNYLGKLKLTPAKDACLTGRQAQIVEMRNERLGGNYGALSEAVKQAIADAKQDIFVYVNCLGFATSVGCNDCGYVEECPNCKNALVYHEKTLTLHCHYCRTQKPMILICPRCHSSLTKLYGAGTEFIEKEVRRIFGADSHKEIIRLDSENFPPEENTEKFRVIIGTKMALRRIRWDKTDLVVFIDIDRQMNIPEYLAQEEVWHLIQEVFFRKQTGAKLIIQTFQKINLICRSLSEPDRFYRTTLNSRRALGYPPYLYLTRYFYGNINAAAAQKEAQQVTADIRQGLTKSQKKIILLGPIEMHPKFYRGQFWYEIIAKLPPDTWQDDLKYLNQFIPANWKIDPNPISILSP